VSSACILTLIDGFEIRAGAHRFGRFGFGFGTADCHHLRRRADWPSGVRVEEIFGSEQGTEVARSAEVGPAARRGR